MFEFMFINDFVNLTQELIDKVYNIIIIQFSGILSLFANLNNAEDKRKLLLNYLVAWYITDNYPDKVINTSSDAGRPVLKKRIDTIEITYKNLKTQIALEPLTSNAWGIKALLLFQGCAERFKIYGSI